jgi:predicted helicase
MELGSAALTSLADDWRRTLFPDASNETFADGYAQAVTFGLLMARAQGIVLSDGLDQVSRALRQTNLLIGTALRVLTDDVDNQATLKTSLNTLTRVLDVVHWPTISKGSPEAWLYFYEGFLSVYDNALKRLTGSYYTPPEIVTAMVRLVDETLRDERRFGVAEGLASPGVTLADPAMGTGTFLLGVLQRIADRTEEDQGEGAVPAIIRAALARLIGFEMQFGPFAVAQLRLTAEVLDLLKANTIKPEHIDLRLLLTDTLGNPNEEHEYIPHVLSPLAASRRSANQIKRAEPITVVIGNPPYRERARGRGGWVESGTAIVSAPLRAWMPPVEWGASAHVKHLRNLYVYFWRWATWKVFGGSIVTSDAPPPVTPQQGVVCFITVAGFLNGPGFQKMRADLRRETDEIWVVDCSPEGHQPPVGSRVFQAVQQPVCIVLAVRLAACGLRPGRAGARAVSISARRYAR